MRRLVGLLRELQRLHGGGPFPLAQVPVAGVLGLSQPTLSRRLALLARRGLIEQASRGNYKKHEAAKYRWCGNP